MSNVLLGFIFAAGATVGYVIKAYGAQAELRAQAIEHRLAMITSSVHDRIDQVEGKLHDKLSKL